MAHEGNPHVTLHDVAAKAGVSISTVSRALNGLPVAKKNLAKVKAASDELGYVANEAARSLRSVRTLSMGVIFHELNTTLGLEVLEALSAAAEEEGYSLFVSTARANEDKYELLVRRFLERRVDALFLVRPIGEGTVLERYEKANVPVLTLFSRDGGYSSLPLVAPTMEDAGRAAIGRLKDLGHRRIALVVPSRRVDYMRALHRIALDNELEVRSFASMEESFDAVSFLDSLKSEPNFPTAAILRAADAVTLLGACNEQKVSVPGDLSIVAIGDIGGNAMISRAQLSTIHLNAAKIGRVAAAEMFERLAGKVVPHEKFVENGTWIERATTGPAAARQGARTTASPDSVKSRRASRAAR
jgi:LacI family transcriptional regulator